MDGFHINTLIKMERIKKYRCLNCGREREKRKNGILVMCPCGYEMLEIPYPNEYLNNKKGGIKQNGNTSRTKS